MQTQQCEFIGFYVISVLNGLFLKIHYDVSHKFANNSIILLFGIVVSVVLAADFFFLGRPSWLASLIDLLTKLMYLCIHGCLLSILLQLFPKKICYFDTSSSISFIQEIHPRVGSKSDQMEAADWPSRNRQQM